MILGGAAILGVAGGLYMSARNDSEEHMAMEHMDKVVDTLPPTRFPMPPPEPDLKAKQKFNGLAVEGLPAYPGAEPSDVLSQAPGVGGEMQIVWFMTDDAPEKVINFYERKFIDVGQPFHSHFLGPASGYIAYLDKNGERMHMLLAMRQGSRTVVFPTSSNPQKLLDSTSKNRLPPEVPEIPGASNSMTFDFDERSLARQSWVATVDGKTVDEVMVWYRQSFKDKGWQVGEPTTNESGEATLEASLTPRHVSMTIKRDKASVTVFLTLSG